MRPDPVSAPARFRATDVAVRAATLLALVAIPARAATPHSGDEWGVWLAADSPHVIDSLVHVPAGAKLVIDPGCTVLLGPAALLKVDGVLVAEGTRERPISFTPNGPTEGAPGDWKGVALLGPGPHRIGWTAFNAATTAVSVGIGSELEMHDSQVYFSSSDGVRFGSSSTGSLVRCRFESNAASGVNLIDASPALTDCAFTGNGRPVLASGRSFPLATRLSASRSAEANGIVLDPTRPVTGLGRWCDAGIPWVVRDGDAVVIDAFADVQALPGCIVKLGMDSHLQVEGSLDSQGVTGAPVTFTSLADDAVGGDTNGDASLSMAGKGDWDAIETGASGNVRLQGAVLAHGTDGLRVVGGSATVVDCVVHEMSDRGLAYGPQATGLVLGTTLCDCNTGLEVSAAARVAAGRPGGASGAGGLNTFECNASFDVANRDDSATFPVQRCWFGWNGPIPSRFMGLVDAGAALSAEADRASDSRPLLVARNADATVVALRWIAGPSCSTTVVSVSDQPDAGFRFVTRTTESDLDVPMTDLPAGLAYIELTSE